MKQRKGDWIQTFTGLQIYPLDPRIEEIYILDIAHSLSMQCRFNGHTKDFYSVAEHCCHVSDLLPDSLKLTGLLHDASETYLCDLPRPLKRSEGFAEQYLIAETHLERAIAEKFNLHYPYPPEVKDADNRLLATEAWQLMVPLHPEWKDCLNPLQGKVLGCWTPREAKEQFLQRFGILAGG